MESIEVDLLLLDIEMPHHTGLEVAEVLMKEGIKTEFILNLNQQ